MKKNIPRGFTLIELLIVIAIIALLATVAVTMLNRAQRKTRDTQRVFDITNMQTALELYYDEHATYPSVTEETTWTTLQDEVNEVTQLKFPLPPEDDESYVYMVDSAHDDQRYVLGTTLEEEKNKMFADDIDDQFGSASNQAGDGTYETPGWSRVTSSTGDAAVVGSAIMNCAEPVYCRFRDAQ